MRDKLGILKSLYEKQKMYLGTQFVSFVSDSIFAVVNLGGFVAKLSIPPNLDGFIVFEVETYRSAVPIREATLREKTSYLGRFPRHRSILVFERNETTWETIEENYGISSAIACENGLSEFESVFVRNYIYDDIDLSGAIVATKMREALISQISPQDLMISGMTPWQRGAYRRVYSSRFLTPQLIEENRRAKEFDRINEAINFLGGRLIDYKEREHRYSITYSVDGNEYSSLVNKDNLQIVSSGICLSGRDSDFDLTSIVPVMRRSRHESDWDY